MIVPAHANQRDPEFHTWVSLCISMGVTSYLELGSSYRSLNYIKAAGIERVAGIDLSGRPLELLPEIGYISGSTQDTKNFEMVSAILDGPPEAVFIDADHETNAVRQDFTAWWPHTTILMGFHDVLMPSVAIFWREISLNYPSVEIFACDIASADAWQTHTGHHPTGRLDCGGIGVLFR
jgi:hypothetical protein